MPKRNDITVEMCVREYKKFPNVTAIAEKLNCSTMTVFDRLHEAGIDTSHKRKYRRNIEKKEKTEKKRRIFASRKEQAQYVCRELGLVEILVKGMRG